MSPSGMMAGGLAQLAADGSRAHIGAMHGPVANALTILLFGLSGLFLLAAALAWAKVARERERPDRRPALSVSLVRSAGAISAAAMGLLGMASIWLALTNLP